jgi:hypothetical protein
MRTVTVNGDLRDVVDVRVGADLGPGIAVRRGAGGRAGREVTPQTEAVRAVLPRLVEAIEVGRLH